MRPSHELAFAFLSGLPRGFKNPDKKRILHMSRKISEKLFSRKKHKSKPVTCPHSQTFPDRTGTVPYFIIVVDEKITMINRQIFRLRFSRKILQIIMPCSEFQSTDRLFCPKADFDRIPDQNFGTNRFYNS